MGKQNSLLYKVYDSVTEVKVAEGTADECAEKLSINRSSFYAFVFRMRNNRTSPYRIEIDILDSYHGRRSRNHYTVISKETGKVIYDGTATECAEALSITVRSFYDMVSRAKNGVHRRYIIQISKRVE